MTDLLIRSPDSEEIGRATYLFRNAMLRPQSRILVAVRSHPMERFVAAVAWWIEGAFGRFQLVGQPGATQPEVFQRLIDRVVEAAQMAGMQRIQYADLLAENDAWSKVLRENGFATLRANHFFEVGYQEAWVRVMRMYEQSLNKIPSNWRTESIRQHLPELALDLIGEHRLIPATELHHYWRTDSSLGFDLDASSILFDGAQSIGVMLLREWLDAYFVDVHVVRVRNRLLRALGNALLLRHVAMRRSPDAQIHRIQFHGGEIEHLETANLAKRMGGHELPSRYIFAKSVCVELLDVTHGK